MPVKPGDTFIFKDTPTTEHLWMIVTNTSHPSGKVVIVNFTGWRDYHCQCCVVMPGDHPFVVKKTSVYYDDARVVSVANLTAAMAGPAIKHHTPLSPELLTRILTGAKLSDRLPLAAKQMIESNA